MYDGILYWFCLDCGSRWHRWPADSYLHDRAEPYVEGTVGGGGAGDRA